MSTIFDYLRTILSEDRRNTVVELGAAGGEDTQRIIECSRFPLGLKCVAVEPDPRNWERLRGRFFGGVPVTRINAAISDSGGWRWFNQSSSEQPEHGFDSGSLLEPTGHVDRYPEIKFENKFVVPTVDLDSLWHMLDLGKVEFIWSDIQGGEKMMINGGQTALWNTHYLYTEYYDKEMYKGQWNLEQIHKHLPGSWTLVEKWEQEALFKNEEFKK